MAGKPQHIGIVGAGLVGSLLSLYLSRRGYTVSVFERRSDMRKNNAEAGRSINLALSTRGIRALEEVGLAEELRKVAIPMHGRVMHGKTGGLTFQPYGKQGQFINSISRGDLNIVLMNAAEKTGVKLFFDSRCIHVDLDKTTVTFQLPQNSGTSVPQTSAQTFDYIIGADGAFSTVRGAMQFTDRYNFSQEYIDHGYKEFHIPAGDDGKHVLEKNALHIWPRESFMMIALPNPDGSFTCTLFFPWKGAPSFESLSNPESVKAFFETTFPDIVQFMPGYAEDFKNKPASSLVTIKCWPWLRNKTLLIGDAAHGVVPFYGQGMNAGFEDCRILNDLLDEHSDEWGAALPEFESLRKSDADAIAQLALDNFVEMRDLVANERFLLQKRIEARLHELYPQQWIPLYSMVTFHDNMRYAEAYYTGLKQKEIMAEVMKTPGIETNWSTLDFQKIVRQL